MKKILNPYYLMAALAVMWVSCKKTDEPVDNPPPAATTGTLKINFNAHYGGAPFAFFTNYNTVQNHRIQIETLRFLITEIWCQNGTGDSLYVADALAIMVQAYRQMEKKELADDALRVLRLNNPEHPFLKQEPSAAAGK